MAEPPIARDAYESLAEGCAADEFYRTHPRRRYFALEGVAMTFNRPAFICFRARR